jgi:hypothetical protein
MESSKMAFVDPCPLPPRVTAQVLQQGGNATLDRWFRNVDAEIPDHTFGISTSEEGYGSAPCYMKGG